MAQTDDLSALMEPGVELTDSGPLEETEPQGEKVADLKLEAPEPRLKLTKETVGTIGGLQIHKVEDQSPNLNLLIYGAPGAGKTVLAGSAFEVPEMSPVLFLDMEGGTFSLRAKYSDIDVVRIETINDMNKLYAELKQMRHGYKTIVIDSLSELQKFALREIMKQVVKQDSDRDPDVPSIREWGKLLNQMRNIITFFRDLPVNTIFTCLGNSVKDEKTGVTSTKPSLSGQLGGEAPGFIDIVAYLYVKSMKVAGENVQQRLLLTGSTGNTVAKDRSDKLPLVVQAPTMQMLHNYIFTNSEKDKG